MLKLAGRTALVLLVLLAGMIAALALLAEPALRLGLRLAGVETMRFEDLSLGPGTIELAGIELGEAGATEGQRIERARIAYRATDLLRGEVGSVEVEGVRLHARLSESGVSLTGLGDGGDGGIFLPLQPESVLLRDAEIAIATPLGTVVATLVDDLRLAGPLSADPAALVARGHAEGRFAIAGEDLEWPGLGRVSRLGGSLALDLGQGRLGVVTRDLALAVAQPAVQLDRLGALLPPPWKISMGDAAPLTVELEPRDSGWAVRLDGPVLLAAGAGRIGAELAAGLEFDAQWDPRRLAPSRAVVTAAGLRVDGTTVESAWAELTGHGEPDELEGRLQVEAAGSGTLGDLVLEQVSLRHDLAASFRGGELELRARDTGSLAAGGLDWGSEVHLGPFAMRLDPTEQPVLSLRPGDGAPTWTHRLAAAIEAPFSAALPGGDAPLDLEIALPQIAIALSGTGSEVREASIDLDGGRVAAEERALSATDLRASVTLEDGAARLAVEDGRLVSSAAPPWFAPLRLTGTLAPSDGGLDFAGRLVRDGGSAEIRFEGRHDPGSGAGRAGLRLPPVELAPGGLQPADLIPAAAGVVDNVAGRIGADGDLSWTAAGDLETRLDVLLGGLSFTIGPARFHRVDGVVALDGLAPPSTPPDQEIAVALLDIGLPLTNGLIDFQLRPDGAIEVEELRWRFAGGTVRAEPFRVRSGHPVFDVTLKAERLSLDRLLALAELEGLSAEGRISGELPVRVQGSGAVVSGGELTSEGPGIVRYRPASPPAALEAGGENVQLLLQALENFRYEELRITLDGRTDAEMDVGLHIEGANPDLYDGHPIEFNLNLEGELGNILARSLAGYRIPEDIRERIQGFPR